MSDPKEALERLTRKCELHEMEPALGLNCIVAKADLSWLIAEREGLEREVERLRGANENLHRRAQAAEGPIDAVKAHGKAAFERWVDSWHFVFKRYLAEKDAREAAESKLSALEGAAREACDLLAERTYGSAARSPGHNARVRLESALSVAPPSQGMETDDLSREYTPTLIAFDDPPRIEYVNADVPHFSRRIDERFALLLDMENREPIGFTLYGKWTSALAALQSHKGGEGDSELAAADNNHKAES
jgi:hypothetical protein